MSKACTHTTTCAMFPLFRCQSNLEIWKISFCNDDFTRCVRYQLALEEKLIPINLLPNGKYLSTATTS